MITATRSRIGSALPSHYPSLSRGSATLGLLGALLLAGSRANAAGNAIRVSVSQFSGDEALAQAVTETLITDLAKSGRITVVDARGSAVKEEGGFTLIGSCLVFDGSVVINARLTDSGSGRSVPGAAENVDGPKSQVFTLVHSLAGRLTNRITGDAPSPAGGVSRKPAGGSVPLPSLKAGLSMPRVTAHLGAGSGRSVSPAAIQPPIMVREMPPGVRPDYAQAANKSVVTGSEDAGASAVADDRSIRSNSNPDSAQDTHVDVIDKGETSDPIGHVERPDRGDRNDRPITRTDEPLRPFGPRYTSLIIDARGLGLDRSMSPQIRRRDGSVVWNGGEADPDFVISDGIVAYASSMREAREQARAGSRPLIIEAVGRHDTPFPSDPLIDEEDADYIRKAARRDGFLKRYRVIFVIGQ